MAKRKSIGLIVFLRGSTKPKDGMPGCCNYDHNSGGCLDKDHCFVVQGKRCGYFEKIVLPTAADIGMKERIYSLYQKHVDIAEDEPLVSVANIRPCPDCGAELRSRQRYCDNCRDKRRRDSYRKRRKK